MNVKLINTEGVSKVTQKVIKDFNMMTEHAFFSKYSCSKQKYLKRFIKYGDPYMKAPLAKIGKMLNKIFKR